MADTVNINQPGLPEYERRTDSDKTTTSGGGTSTQQLAPEATAALGEMGGAIDQQKQVASAEGDLKVQGATEDNAVEQDLNQQQQQLAAEKMAALTGQFSATGELYQQQKARIKQQQDRYEAMDAPALFANRDNAGKYRLGIGIALAGLGDAMRQAAMVRIGKDPGSASTVKDIINGDLERQKEAINKARDSVLQARTGLKDIDDARNAALGDIDMKGAILAKKASDQLRANLAARGVPQAQIDADKRIADLDQFAATKKLDVAGSLHTTIDKHFSTAIKNGSEEINRTPTEKGDSGKVTPKQAEMAEAAASLDNELATIRKLGVVQDPKAMETIQNNQHELESVANGGVSGMVAKGAQRLGLAARNSVEGLNEKQGLLYNAWKNAAEPIIHARTGAGKPAGEAQDYAEQLRPVAGDSPEMQAQKFRRMEFESWKLKQLAGKTAAEQLNILDTPMPPRWGERRSATAAPGSPPASGMPAPVAPAQAPPTEQLTPARRAIAVQTLRQMPDGPKRQLLAEKFGILPEELTNGR